MTPHFSAQQNQTRLIAVFLCTFLMGLTFYVMRGTTQGSRAEAADAAMFMGLRHASAKEIHQVWPEAKGKMALLSFGSRLCHDCKRMAPIVSKAISQHPQMAFRKIDVLEDRQKYPAVFRVFKPVSVPMLVLIDARGEIRDVLYNYQSPDVVAKALEQLQTSVAASKSATRKP